MPLTVAHSFPVWLPQTQTWLYHQARHLPADRIAAHVICRVTQNLDQFALSSMHSLYAAASPLSRFGERLLRNTDFHAYNAWKCRRIKADILHSHFGPIAWKNMKMLSLPRMWGQPGPKHVVTFYGQDVDRLPKTHPSWTHRYRELFSRVDAVLCEGPHMTEKIQELGCAPEKIFLHRLGVSLENRPFEPPVKQQGEPFKILMAAAFRPKKGLLDGLKALEMVSQRFDLQITLVGDSTGETDSEREKASIRSFLSHSSLGVRVRLTGFMNAAELGRLAREHHIYLCPSKTAPDGDTEGGAPVSLIEMAASGLPVVSTRHADIPDILEHGVSGLLAPENEPAALARCLEELCSDPTAWPRLAQHARQVVESRHNAVKQGLQLSNIYEQVYNNTFEGNTIRSLVVRNRSERSRILFVSHSDGLYGAEKSLLTLVEGLHGLESFEILVIVPGTGPLYEELKRRRIPVLVRHYERWAGNRSPLIGLAWRAWSNMVHLGDLAREMRRWKPDIIYSNSLATPVGAHLSGVIGPDCLHVWHVREALWKREWGFLDYGVKRSMAFVQASTDLIICNSLFIQQQMQLLLPADEKKVPMKVVYNGIAAVGMGGSTGEAFDTSTSERMGARSPGYKTNESQSPGKLSPSHKVSGRLPTGRRISTGRLQLLVAGSITPLKNIGEAIQAVHCVSMELNIPVYLDIRGDGDASERRRLEKLVRRLNLNARVRFLPYSNRMDKVFAEADILLVPSRNESFGRIAVEAMMAGVVVVASNQGGLPEIVEHGQNGLLYEPGRPEALASQIRSLCDDDELYERLALKGSKTAFVRFAESHYIAQIRALLLSLLSDRHSG